MNGNLWLRTPPLSLCPVLVTRVISKDKSFSRFYFRIIAQIITNDVARRQPDINHAGKDCKPADRSCVINTPDKCLIILRMLCPGYVLLFQLPTVIYDTFSVLPLLLLFLMSGQKHELTMPPAEKSHIWWSSETQTKRKMKKSNNPSQTFCRNHS